MRSIAPSCRAAGGVSGSRNGADRRRRVDPPHAPRPGGGRSVSASCSGPLRASARAPCRSGCAPSRRRASSSGAEFAEAPPRVEYRLAAKGVHLVPIVDAMREYGSRWLGGGPCDDEASEPGAPGWRPSAERPEPATPAGGCAGSAAAGRACVGIRRSRRFLSSARPSSSSRWTIVVRENIAQASFDVLHHDGELDVLLLHGTRPASLKAGCRSAVGMLARLARPASAPGARRPTTAITIPMNDASIGRRRSNAVTLATKRPPGRSARKTSVSRRREVGHLLQRHARHDAVEGAVGYQGIIWASPGGRAPASPRGPRPRRLDALGAEVDPDDHPLGPTMRAAARVAPPEPRPMSSTRFLRDDRCPGRRAVVEVYAAVPGGAPPGVLRARRVERVDRAVERVASRAHQRDPGGDLGADLRDDLLRPGGRGRLRLGRVPARSSSTGHATRAAYGPSSAATSARPSRSTGSWARAGTVAIAPPRRTCRRRLPASRSRMPSA